MKMPRTIKNLFNACSVSVLRRRAILSPLRAKAKQSPAATAAFAWLEAENIKVIIDDNCLKRKVMGRYNREGSKRWIALSPKFLDCDPVDCIDTLVHEIRHAWQDKHDLMLPYSLKFNMKHGMQQAFLWLCAEEADAHAHGLFAAGEAFGATIEQPLGYQAAYINWFTGRLDSYLDTFITEWTGLITDIEKRTAGDAAKMRDYLADCCEAEQEPLDQTVLRALGQPLIGANYQHDGDFSLWVQDVLIPKALAGPIAARQAEFIALDARMAAFTTLAANQNNQTAAPAPRRRGNG